MNLLLSEEVFRTIGEFLWVFFRPKESVSDRIFDLVSNFGKASKNIIFFLSSNKVAKDDKTILPGRVVLCPLSPGLLTV
jgi:hypothetical protein